MISVVGDQFEEDHVAVMAFGNKFLTNDISSWQLDASYESIITASAQGRGLEVATENLTPDERSNLLKFYYKSATGTAIERLISGGDDWNKIKSSLTQFASRAHADEVLVLVPTGSGDFIGNTSRGLTGLGTYNHMWHHESFLNSSLYLYDVASSKPICNTAVSAVAKDRAVLGGIASGDVPHVQLPEEIEGKTFDEMSADQQLLLKSQFTQFVDPSVADGTLTRLLKDCPAIPG